MVMRIVMNVGIQDAIDRVDAYITKVSLAPFRKTNSKF